MRIVGIDEAGRGPVIGPMVLAGVQIGPGDEATLKEWGVKDSKLLSHKKREELFDKIISTFSYKIVKVSPSEIDEVLCEDNSSNLNWLEADHQAVIVSELDCDRAIIDCPSRNLESFTDYLRKKVPLAVELVVENKADMNHVVVGAASILAKVTRDREIKALHESIGVDFGSGYLTDPKTSTFLKARWKDFPTIFRQRWAPYKALVAEASQSSLGSFSK